MINLFRYIFSLLRPVLTGWFSSSVLKVTSNVCSHRHLFVIIIKISTSKTQCTFSLSKEWSKCVQSDLRFKRIVKWSFCQQSFNPSKTDNRNLRFDLYEQHTCICNGVSSFVWVPACMSILCSKNCSYYMETFHWNCVLLALVIKTSDICFTPLSDIDLGRGSQG